MAQPEFSVIIPVVNKWELTKDCLVSLREHSGGHDFEVIVVDNASSDVTPTDLAPLGENLFGERFTAIRFEENRNFGPACNAGAKAATAPLLFFLNNDTLLTPGWAAPLLSALREDPQLGAVGPLLLYANDTVQHLGVVYSPRGGVHLYRDFPRTHPVVARRRDLQCLTGAAIMLSTTLFFDCGGFYEEYINGYEDQELSLRIRQAGKKLTCIPESVVYHLESQSLGRHDTERHNGRIFRERCSTILRVDYHTQGLRDGFNVFVNDLLTLSLCLRKEEEAALTGKAQGQPPAVWAQIMAANPYWTEGPDYLAEICAQQGKHQEELMLRLRMANVYPILERYLRVMDLSPFYSEESAWAIFLRRNLAAMQFFQRDKRAAVQKVRAFQREFSAENPAFLERLYDEKLQSMFPG